MLNTTEQRIRAHITVREENIRKTQPKIRAVPMEPADEMSPTNKQEEVSASTKPNSPKRNKYILMYILLTVGAGVAVGLLFMR